MALKTRDLKHDSSEIGHRGSLGSTGGNREKSQANTAATSNAVSKAAPKDSANDP